MVKKTARPWGGQAQVGERYVLSSLLTILLHTLEVVTIFKTARKMARLSQGEAHFKSGISLKRLQRIESGAEYPLPGEIKLLDKCYGAGGMLVLRYCGTCCPDGKYAGLQFENISPQSAGIKLITSLTGIEALMPDIADVVCEICDGVLSPNNREKRNQICLQLSQLRRYIMAIEVLLMGEKSLKDKDIRNVKECLIQIKEKAACGGAQTASRR